MSVPSAGYARHADSVDADVADTVCPLCGADESELIQRICTKPDRENDFGIPADEYQRDLRRCDSCSVYFNAHDMLSGNLYAGDYNAAVYQDRLKSQYDRVMALPHDRSDNRGRVERVIGFCNEHGLNPEGSAVLDVGSGLCVFLGGMKEHGFSCDCLDPDPAAVAHAVNHVGIDHGFAGTLESFSPQRTYSLITLNKVLEHVAEPAAMLWRASLLLNDRGVIHVEVPDGEAAAAVGGVVDREEFFIEHMTIYSRRSLEVLINRAGLQPVQIESIHEPSDKYTLYAFLRARD